MEVQAVTPEDGGRDGLPPNRCAGTHVSESRVLDVLRRGGADDDMAPAGGRPLDAHRPGQVERFLCEHPPVGAAHAGEAPRVGRERLGVTGRERCGELLVRCRPCRIVPGPVPSGSRGPLDVEPPVAHHPESDVGVQDSHPPSDEVRLVDPDEAERVSHPALGFISSVPSTTRLRVSSRVVSDAGSKRRV